MNGPDGLRSIARQRFRELGQQTTWIQGCDKGDLVDAVIQGAPPMDAPLDDVNTDVNTETNTPGADLAQVIAQAVQAHIKLEPEAPPIDEESIRHICKQEIANSERFNVKHVEVKRVDGTAVDVGAQHKDFDTLLTMVCTGVPVYMVGPSGSGKTHAAEAVAKALGLTYHCQSVSQQTTVSYLLGYMDANGNYITTEFRKAYENGGVFMLDEIDAGNSNVLLVLNSALANNSCAFADGMIKRHDDFRLIAAGNTFGRGADRQYVGRCQLDESSLKRFASLVWDYDEDLERAISGDIDWTVYVQSTRRAAAELQLRVVISPRQSIQGALLLAAGLDRSIVEESVLFAGMDADTVSKLKERVAA